jgi:hypothetical protein
MGLGGIDDGWQVRNGFLQRGVAINRVLPDLVSVGGKVDFAVLIAVKNPGAFIVKIENRRGVVVAFKKCLVGSDDFGILGEPLPYAIADADDALDAVGRKEGVAENLTGLLANTVNATRALDEANDCPGQIEVHDYRTILEVLALAEDVGGD